jgi:hypothetical protein
VVAEAAATRGEADPAVVARLLSALDAAQVSWTVAAKRWGELTSPAERADPRLLGAAGEVGPRSPLRPSTRLAGPAQTRSPAASTLGRP